jgi:hypothetical protein
MTSFRPSSLTQAPPLEFRPPWDDYLSAHPLKIDVRGPASFPRPRWRNRPRASSGRRGTTTLPPTLSRSTRRGLTSFPPSALTQSPPLELRPPCNDSPPVHPLKIDAVAGKAASPVRADASSPARAREGGREGIVLPSPGARCIEKCRFAVFLFLFFLSGSSSPRLCVAGQLPQPGWGGKLRLPGQLQGVAHGLSRPACGSALAACGPACGFAWPGFCGAHPPTPPSNQLFADGGGLAAERNFRDIG